MRFSFLVVFAALMLAACDRSSDPAVARAGADLRTAGHATADAADNVGEAGDRAAARAAHDADVAADRASDRVAVGADQALGRTGDALTREGARMRAAARDDRSDH